MLSVGGSNPFFRDGLEFAWRWLRGMRADPPGAAKTNADRADTFNMALEQSEQLFKVAASADVATKPLLVFYGLTQAARAIAAMAPNVLDRQQVQGKPSEPWKLYGHGIEIPGMAQTVTAAGGKLALIPVSDNRGSGAFTQMAEILGSGSLINRKADGTAAVRVTMGELWDTLPETLTFPLWRPGAAAYPFLSVDSGGRVHVPSVGWGRWGQLGRVPDAVKSAGTTGAIKEFLAHYPDVGEWRRHADVSIGAFPNEWMQDTVLPQLNLLSLLFVDPEQPVPPAEPASDGLDWVGTAYFKERYLFPALGDNPKPLHPLLAWWAILYVLSMVARYEPRAWNQMIAIGSSVEASPIEHLLGAAVLKLPRLILDTMDDLAP